MKPAILISLGVLLLGAIGAGVWWWQDQQQQEATRLAVEAAWQNRQNVETARLQSEFEAGIALARRHVEESAAEARRRFMLSIDSIPTGATLLLRKTESAQTPLQAATPFRQELPRGRYVASLDLSGHESWTDTIDLLDTNQSRQINLPLIPIPAKPAPIKIEPDTPTIASPRLPPKTTATTTVTKPIRPPKLRSQVAPIFPANLRRAGISGTAVVKFVVNTVGIPEDIQVASTSDQAFGIAAVEAVRQWRFEPAMADGQPVRYTLQVPIQFNLD